MIIYQPEKKQEIRARVNRVAKKFRKASIRLFVTELSANAERSLQWTFERSARRNCKEYSKMNAQSHRAFIRHNGSYKTKKAGQGDWNKDFLRPVKDGIDRAFA